MAKKEQEKPEVDNLMKQPNPGIVREFIDFARAHKKLWLVPLFLILLLVGFLILIGGSSAAPFIYRLF
ncbi:MAG: DUF5989 family protein [Oceanipulchritudo sp.]